MISAKLKEFAVKVAIVHEWLSVVAGSEKVLAELVDMFPDADLFAVVDFLDPSARGFIHDKSVNTSFIQALPGSRRWFRHYLPLMPLAVEQFDLSSYDLVISSSHAVAKGVITGPDQVHISYIHSPMRYVWDMQHEHLRESNIGRGLKGWLVRWVLHKLRTWDVRTAHGVDAMVANSEFIARRIKKIYGREAEVVYPPVDVDAFSLHADKEDFYLAASRMVPYKRIDVIVESFAGMPDKELVVIGDGPCMRAVRAKAAPNVKILGYQPFERLRHCMQRARAFVFAAEEDFGIAPVEAQACGTPVIAFGRGGALETVRGLETEGPTGIFFDRQEPECLRQAVAAFEANRHRFTPAACRANAESFSRVRFRDEMTVLISREMARLNAFRPFGGERKEHPREWRADGARSANGAA